MTKQQAETLFRESLPEILKSTDRPLKRQAWGDFTDSLCKNGEITPRQYDRWLHPRFIERRVRQ